VFGNDFDILGAAAARIAEVLEKDPGASEVAVEQTTGLPMLQIRGDRSVHTGWD
jgi:cobalt-zinc-cadmium resistance protein CzcA